MTATRSESATAGQRQDGERALLWAVSTHDHHNRWERNACRCLRETPAVTGIQRLAAMEHTL